LYGLRNFFSDAVSTVFLIGLAVLVRIAEYWYRDKREKTELALEEQKLELELLKAQINPHFFFNTNRFQELPLSPQYPILQLLPLL
jgi:LytS/YehU family sensor histidine kinase